MGVVRVLGLNGLKDVERRTERERQKEMRREMCHGVVAERVSGD
jgi:hypothetical protein